MDKNSSAQKEWAVAEAKNRFSELITRALTEGPQRISRRGKSVVLISEETYAALSGHKPNFIEFLMNGPDLSDLDLARNPSTGRDVDFGAED